MQAQAVGERWRILGRFLLPMRRIAAGRVESLSMRRTALGAGVALMSDDRTVTLHVPSASSRRRPASRRRCSAKSPSTSTARLGGPLCGSSLTAARLKGGTTTLYTGCGSLCLDEGGLASLSQGRYPG